MAPGPRAPTRDALDTGDTTAPFALEPLELDEVLRRAMEQNTDLGSRAVDVDISRASVLSALGAYDLTLIAGVNGSRSEAPQRGSQITFNRGSRSWGAYTGLRRQLETGGLVELRFDGARTITQQPANFFDPNSGATTIASYRVAPTLTLTHPLLRGAGIKVNRAAIHRGEIATSQAQAAELEATQNLVRDLIGAYWDVLAAMRSLDNKRRSLELARAQLERTRAQVAAGRLAPVDAKSVEQALAARENDVLLAENQLLDTSLTLRTRVGQDIVHADTIGVLPQTDPVVRPQTPDPSDAIDRAMRSHPGLRQLELALASRRIDELEAANQRLAQLDFRGTFVPQGRSADEVAQPQLGVPAHDGSWGEAFANFFNDSPRDDGLLADWTLTGNLDLTWDIRNRAAKGNHQRIAAELRKAQINLENLRQSVAAQVIRANNSLRTASKRIDVADVSLELAQDNLKAEQARFDVGRSTNYDVLERLEELDRAEADALSAQVEYLKATVALQALTGEILPAFGIKLRS